MKYLLFSDVHGNLEALESLLVYISKVQPDKVLFLGDAVGYGANPVECLLVITETADLCLQGNHDAAAAGALSINSFNPLAQQAILWTEQVLTEEEKTYLHQLPLILHFPEFCLVHASPMEPEQWHYLLKAEDAARNFPFFSSPLCFIGHSHRPGIFALDQRGVCRDITEESLTLEGNFRYIVNVGSVGQPRDGNPKAACCLFDSSEKSIRIHRLAYNLERTQQKIRQAHLPSFLAERLSYGI